MTSHVRFPTLSDLKPTARVSLETSTYAQVDSILKELKYISRQLQPILASHSEELRVLERLYYKGKNQHRSALFWRRVVEIRRLGGRLEDVGLLALLDGFRGSFHANDGPSKGSKNTRTAWTQIPDSRYVTTVSKRLYSACLLIDQSRERFIDAHRSFVLLMQSATFLPLALALVAITCRLDLLLGECRSVIEEEWHSIQRLFSLTESPSDFHQRIPDKLPRAPHTIGLASKVANAPEILPLVLDTGDGEDTGLAINRELSVMRIEAVVATSPAQDLALTVPDSVIMDEDALQSEATVAQVEQSALMAATVILPTPPATFTLSIPHAEKRNVEDRPLDPRPKKKKKKSKGGKRDEIDDIFGI